jgi:DNA-binding phage protein
MPLTRDFRETVKNRAANDPVFRGVLFNEAITAFLEGDLETGNIILRDYINATVGFEKLSSEIGAPSKSLMRMFSSSGNPTAKNLLAVISYLQRNTGVDFKLK